MEPKELVRELILAQCPDALVERFSVWPLSHRRRMTRYPSGLAEIHEVTRQSPDEIQRTDDYAEAGLSSTW